MSKAVQPRVRPQESAQPCSDLAPRMIGHTRSVQRAPRHMP